jgi:hypothetical protein
VALSDSSSPGEPPLRDGRGPVLADAPVEASLVSSVELQDTE